MKHISEAFTKEDILKIGAEKAIGQFKALSDEDFIKILSDKDRDWNCSNTADGLYINIWDVGIELSWNYETLFYYVTDEENKDSAKAECEKYFKGNSYCLEKLDELFKAKDYDNFESSFVDFESTEDESEAESEAKEACGNFMGDVYWAIEDAFDRNLVKESVPDIKKAIIDEISSWE